MSRWLVLGWSLLSYLVFFGVFLYAVGFIGNLWVPTSLDAEPHSPLGFAVAVNGLLLGLFAIQHSVMARPFFKRWITQFIPAAAERPTYVMATNLALIALFIWWQPMGISIWNATSPLLQVGLYAVFFAGWALVFVSTCLINHFDLFGLRQGWYHFLGQPYPPLTFVTPALYKHVRHPLYIGWLMVFWATPTMTAGHLLFALLTTGYILIAVQLEERDLIAAHGSDYVNYRNQVPMFIPRFRRAASADSDVHSWSRS